MKVVLEFCAGGWLFVTISHPLLVSSIHDKRLLTEFRKGSDLFRSWFLKSPLEDESTCEENILLELRHFSDIKADS